MRSLWPPGTSRPWARSQRPRSSSERSRHRCSSRAGLPVPSSPVIEITPGHGHAAAGHVIWQGDDGDCRGRAAIGPMERRFASRSKFVSPGQILRQASLGSASATALVSAVGSRADSVGSRISGRRAGEAAGAGHRRRTPPIEHEADLLPLAPAPQAGVDRLLRGSPAATTRTTCTANAARAAPAVPTSSGGPSITTSPRDFPARSSHTSWPCAGWRAPGLSWPKVCPAPD